MSKPINEKWDSLFVFDIYDDSNVQNYGPLAKQAQSLVEENYKGSTSRYDSNRLCDNVNQYLNKIVNYKSSELISRMDKFAANKKKDQALLKLAQIGDFIEIEDLCIYYSRKWVRSCNFYSFLKKYIVIAYYPELNQIRHEIYSVKGN